ncbi:MAG: hypothetical protein ACR2RB_16935 [Gammaproteobacteria bacterium]
MLHIVMTDGTDDIKFVWGLGPAVWDNNDVSEPSFPPASAPSAARIGTNRWLVAFRRGDNTVTVTLYNHEERRFIGDCAPPGPLNTNVVGRPAITSTNGKLALAWHRVPEVGPNFSFVTAAGQVEAGLPTFSPPRQLDLPLTGELEAGMLNDPDVTHNHNQFYIT